MTTTQRIHHLTGRPKTPEHRAKIAASKIVDKDRHPDRWQAEYELALEVINRKEANRNIEN